jgi:hypothetical protein
MKPEEGRAILARDRAEKNSETPEPRFYSGMSSGNLDYHGPVVVPPDLGPDDLDEHGQQMADDANEPRPPDEEEVLTEFKGHAHRERNWPIPKGITIDSGDGPQPYSPPKLPPLPEHWKDTYRRAWDRLSPQDQRIVAEYVSESGLFSTTEPEPGSPDWHRKLAEWHDKWIADGERPEDVDDAMRMLIREEIADPARVEIEFERVMDASARKLKREG